MLGKDLLCYKPAGRIEFSLRNDTLSFPEKIWKYAFICDGDLFGQVGEDKSDSEVIPTLNAPRHDHSPESNGRVRRCGALDNLGGGKEKIDVLPQGQKRQTCCDGAADHN